MSAMKTGVAKLPQLRILVNSRCGRACFFCRPSGEGITTLKGKELDADLVFRVASLFVECGGQEIKLSGGDPALWSPLVDAIRKLKMIRGLKSVQVISRHPRIGDLAFDLHAAGLDLVNISIDTLNPHLHQQITGVNDLAAVIVALEKCVSVGIPCKVNTVVMAGINDGEIWELIKFCEASKVRTLKLLDVIQDLETGSESYAARLYNQRAIQVRALYKPLSEIANDLKKRAIKLSVVGQGGFGHPMLNLQMPSGLEVLIKDHTAGAWYGAICNGCKFYPCHDALMALRLTADARLQFCLLREEIAIDLKPLIKSPNGELKNTIADALTNFDTAYFLSQKEAA
jgi:cyclic pyranopterin phosphate synthase